MDCCGHLIIIPLCPGWVLDGESISADAATATATPGDDWRAAVERRFVAVPEKGVTEEID